MTDFTSEWAFRPQEDITVYELAVVMSKVVVGRRFGLSLMKCRTGEHAARHWVQLT